MSRAHFSVAYDFCCAPCVDRWRAELLHVRASIADDAAHIRKHRSVLRKRPEKGVVRLVLACGWLGWAWAQRAPPLVDQEVQLGLLQGAGLASPRVEEQWAGESRSGSEERRGAGRSPPRASRVARRAAASASGAGEGDAEGPWPPPTVASRRPS